jgi:TonB-linked SusC/RagA family outer membrane protein
MKVSVLLLFIGVTTLVATPVFSQPEKVNLQMTDVTLREVFHEIEKQSDYNFFYNDQFVDLNEVVAINEVNSPISDVLKNLLGKTGLSYRLLDDNLIVITPKQEQQIVRGKITDTDGRPLPGVTIVVKGTAKGVTTNSDGNYEIDLAIEDKVLVFSFLGLQTQEIPVNNRSVINVTLQESTSMIDDVVVIGYGTARKRDLTGSVVSVKADEVRNISVPTIDNALAGKAAGVQIVKADGSPGGGVRMRIRGGTSLIGGNDPLYIVDGVQITPQNRYIQNAAEITSPVELLGSGGGSVSSSFARGLNNLGGLNLNDIESIDILKDASATAIYGSKAANGVVIITTRTGAFEQKPTLELNYYTGFSQPINEKRLNREQYIMIMQEGARNLNAERIAQGLPTDQAADQILNNPDYYGTGNTDWVDLVTRTGIAQNVDLSIRGGGKGSRYYTSLGYSSQTGVVKGTDFSRISGKINLDNSITSRLRLLNNFDFGFTTNNITNGIYSNAQLTPPTFEPYNEDGSIHLFDGSALGGYTSLQNPLALLKGINEAKIASLIGSMALEYKIFESLKFRSSASVNYSSYQQLNYAPSIAQLATWQQSNLTGGIGSQGQTVQTDLFFENTLTWDKEFNENHRLIVLAGTSWQQAHSSSFSATGQGYPDDEYLIGLSSAAIALMPSGSSQQNSLLSFYLRTNYTIRDRYLITFTGRSDASSKFPKSNRVGYFPSFGIAWRISEESFMQWADWLDELKLRASAGYTGTQNIGNNMFYTLYSPASYAGSSALIPSQLGNDEIKWENTLQKDLGLDFSFFNSRLNGTIGYYEKNTTGILLASPVPPSSGFNQVLRNVANIRNRGLEFDAKGDIIRGNAFKWSLAFNISANRSKVMKISRDRSDGTSGQLTDDPFINSLYMGNSIIREGEPLGLLYGYKFTGLIRTQEQLDQYSQDALFVMYGFWPYLNIGDAMYELVEEEGDWKGWFKPTVIGNAEPDFFGGITNTFEFKGISLSALFSYSYGGDIIYLADMHNLSLQNQANKGVRILDRYTETNTETDRPRLVLNQLSAAFVTNPISSMVYDGSYIKLKTLTLAWQIPAGTAERLKLNSASVYISASNLFTITNYPGSDPEVTDDPYSIIGGYSDPGTYPSVRQYSCGLRLAF